jgi:acetyl-CoA carboxylase carboxyltransferase component/biotin carboxyl carrier protein
VEHTITEEITGIDIVKAQLMLATGRSLDDLHLKQSYVQFRPGFAMELRINAETIDREGRVEPSHGVIAAYDTPSGPGIRIDSAGHTGFRTNPRFDPLLAKLVTYSPSSALENLMLRASRALYEFCIDGISTNIPLLLRLLQHPDVRLGRFHSQFVEEHIPELLSEVVQAAGMPTVATAGDKQSRPLAVGPGGTVPVASVMQATVVSIDVKAGDLVAEGQPIAVLEAMKMQHLVTTSMSGIVRHVNVCTGDMVFEGQALLFIEPAGVAIHKAEEQTKIDLDHVRRDLAEVIERQAIGSDERRPEAVARRRKSGQRTARENIADLCDHGSFTEYGALAIAAQRRRRSLDDLIKNTPADGLVAGIGTVNGSIFPQVVSRCMVMAYDYTVLAGTQGRLNHKKMDHMIRLADQWRLPLVLFAEGGGGRPGDTDGLAGAHLDVITFHHFARLSGKVPLVGVVSGRCFAGNAALLGCCDVIIATENSSIGMAGPAMIEGGGLGVYEPQEVGPIHVQTRNGVVDIAVRDEVEGVQAAKKYLSFYQGSLTETKTAVADQRVLRTLIPENRLRVYDVRKVIEVLVDTGWYLELRRDWAPGMITGLIRIEGQALGLIANNPTHLAGAIDPDGADKAARFMQLCEAYGLPILSLCDTPGFMVGPEIERRAQVRHTSRMFLAGSNLTVPYIMVTLRKGYGLGAQAMAGGCSSTPLLHVSWPTGEFGPMGLEGAVKLGFRKELEAIQDPEARQNLFDEMLAKAYENGKALNVASFLEFDDVIDPAETRMYIVRALKSVPSLDRSAGKRRPFIDAW